MLFRRKIRELRQSKKWSVYDLADKIRKTAGYVSKIEVRGEIPSPEMIIRLSEVLNADVEELIEIAKNEKSKEASQAVQRKYDDGLKMYRQSKKGNKGRQ
jgi:transcriptional regulator with XRE-family HTH domain